MSIPVGLGSIICSRRLSRKASSLEGSTWILKQTVVLTFVGHALPSRYFVLFGYSFHPVEQYIYPVVQCFNCCSFGYAHVQCRSEPRSYKFGDNHDWFILWLDGDYSCINYCGHHKAADKSCSEFVWKKDIKHF